MNKAYRKYFTLVFVLLVAVTFAGCSRNQASENPLDRFAGQNPRVQIEMEDGGIMVLELYPELAPETVTNFVVLADSGFYDGLKFHRIIEGFMIQGGDPKGDGTGGSENTIPGEFANNGFTQNTLKHEAGVISMARSNDPNSASSQFFIVDGDASFLDGSYAAFGKLIEGMETLKFIADTPVDINPYTGEPSVPQVDVVIKTVTILDNAN